MTGGWEKQNYHNYCHGSIIAGEIFYFQPIPTNNTAMLYYNWLQILFWRSIIFCRAEPTCLLMWHCCVLTTNTCQLTSWCWQSHHNISRTSCTHQCQRHLTRSQSLSSDYQGRKYKCREVDIIQKWDRLFVFIWNSTNVVLRVPFILGTNELLDTFLCPFEVYIFVGHVRSWDIYIYFHWLGTDQWIIQKYLTFIYTQKLDFNSVEDIWDTLRFDVLQ